MTAQILPLPAASLPGDAERRTWPIATSAAGGVAAAVPLVVSLSDSPLLIGEDAGST
jgi:hypothetical protein